MLQLRASLFYLGIGLASLLTILFSPPFLILPYRWRYLYFTRWGRFTIWWLRITCRLDYRILVNSLIAEHKSQGTMQLLMGRDGAELERYWYLAANPPGGAARAERLFARLAEPLGAPGPRDAF